MVMKTLKCFLIWECAVAARPRFFNLILFAKLLCNIGAKNDAKLCDPVANAII